MSEEEKKPASEGREMLGFEKQIFQDILEKDGLVVCARGINLDVVLFNLLHVYCDPGNLIIVMNHTDYEEKHYLSQFDDNVYTSLHDVAEREERYLLGGIHFVTTRILVVDLLKKRIPIEKITGIFVLRAHSILESCQEAFALRLYRQNNKTGFVKGFSNCVESFTFGFGHVERVMRALFVKELFIWPRFHRTVIQSLKPHEPEVVELHIPISASVREMQTCLLEVINHTINEVKRINKYVELEEITVESCVSAQLDRILRSQLDGLWDSLSPRSKQLAADLKTLKHLAFTLLLGDSVQFLAAISPYRVAEYALNASWVLSESADRLFTRARARVFTSSSEFLPELHPRWDTLLELLTVEIPIESEKRGLEAPKILVLCNDASTCYQLSQVLSRGPYVYLYLMALKNQIKINKVSDKIEAKLRNLPTLRIDCEPQTNKKAKLDETVEKSSAGIDEVEDVTTDEEMSKCSYLFTMTQRGEKNNVEEDTDSDSYNRKVNFEHLDEVENLDLSTMPQTDPVLLIQTFKNDYNILSLPKTLTEMQPDFIVMYHSNMAAIRQIEIFEARRKKEPRTKVYFLMHAETIEEQGYLTTLRREKEAFEHLIEIKSTMVVPEYQDGKTDSCTQLQTERQVIEKSTRKGGRDQGTSSEKPFIIVDMREFRSDLPALIHKRGIEIEPVTLAVGDYILTPEICVERKSISDLIGSLNSGRLYQQCTAMERNYESPMLLIEFESNRPFKWPDDGEARKKLQLLTLHFPKLRLVWSAGPYASAQLFEEMKQHKAQPIMPTALDAPPDPLRTIACDFLRRLPGVTSKNVDTLVRAVPNMSALVNLTQNEINNIIHNTIEARTLHDILHAKHEPTDAQKGAKGKAIKKFRYLKK